VNIAALVISYNSQGFLEKNLSSMLNQSYPFTQIIVIDNNSSDHSLAIVRQFPTVKLKALKENIGYAAAVNLGLNTIDCDFILIANADIYLEPQFNQILVESFKNDSSLEMISPLILRFDQKTVDSAGQHYSYALHPKEIGYNNSIKNLHISKQAVFSVCGAATLIHKHAVEKLQLDNQLYDEDFFIFWEDFDLGWRAELLGIRKMFIPELRLYHYRSATLKKNLLAKISLALARDSEIKFHLVKNRYLTLIKNFRWQRFWWTCPFILVKDIIWVSLLTFSAPKIIIKLMKSGHLFKNAFLKRKKLLTLEKALRNQ
jgi:GT2 family glycosyltransferase